MTRDSDEYISPEKGDQPMVVAFLALENLWLILPALFLGS
jgi:hypothetical protein